MLSSSSPGAKQRFADTIRLPTVAVERAAGEYQAGRWETALTTIRRHLEDPFWPTACIARDVHGRIAVAQERDGEALADVERVMAYAESSRDSQPRLMGLSLQVLRADAVGDDLTALTTADAFLTEWTRIGGMFGRLVNLSEIAPILAKAGRHGDLERAARHVKIPSRWTEAIMATVERRYSDAADIHAEIGSMPQCAAAHMLSAEAHVAAGRHAAALPHVEAATGFYRLVGATVYLRRADTLLAKSA